MPHTILGAWDRSSNKKTKLLALIEFTFQGMCVDVGKVNNQCIEKAHSMMVNLGT
jgi:hypothetical protein